MHNAQHLANYRRPSREIWSVSRLQQEKYLSSNIMQKMMLETISRPLFCCLKELRNYKRKLFLCPPQKQARTSELQILRARS